MKLPAAVPDSRSAVWEEFELATTDDARVTEAVNRFHRSPAAKHLSALGIHYGIAPHAKGVRSAEEFARAAGISLDRVFKTMLLKDSSGKYFLFICPAAERVDFDRLRERFGTKPTLAKRDEVSAATGYEPNSVSPFGIKRQLPLYADSRLFHGDRVYLGSGTPRIDIEITTQSVLEALQPICIG